MPTDRSEIDKFLVENSPARQLDLAQDPDECFFGDYPTLSEVKAQYGSNASVTWLLPQLFNLSEYCGVKDKLHGDVMLECAGIIASEFFYLKTSEIMLFMVRFKAGKYGRFYGKVDPMMITMALRQFCLERNTEYGRKEEEERMERTRKMKEDAISYDEYVRKYKGKIEPNKQ